MENENADKPKEKVVEFCRETTKIIAVGIVKDFLSVPSFGQAPKLLSLLQIHLIYFPQK